MSVSGPVLHQQLMDAYAAVQADLESARGEIIFARGQRDDLDDQRGEALAHLAEHYLPELTPEAIGQTWVEVRSAVAEVLHRKQDHARRLAEDLKDLSDRRQRQEQRLLETTDELDRAVDQQAQITGELEQRLLADDEFVRLSDRAAMAEAALERAEANLHEIDQDSVRKLPAYDESSLFRYLYDRGYGTVAYNKRGITRRIDRWLARYVDFQKARQGYDFLRKTPEQMRQIIAEDREALDAVMTVIERRRDNLAEELGLNEVIVRAEELTRSREEQLKSLDAVLADEKDQQTELSELDNPRGTYYREAIGVFRDALDHISSRELKQRAKRTPEIVDDQIVARLMGVESDMDRVDDAARRRRAEIDRTQGYLEDLGRLVQRFRAAQFDSARSQFVDSLDVYDEVTRAREKGSVESLWQRIRRAQRWGPTTTDKITNVATHPLTQVLINAMAHAAGGAMQGHARRAANRRMQNRFRGSWGNSGSGSWGGDSSDANRRRR